MKRLESPTQWSSRPNPLFFLERDDVLPSAKLGFLNIKTDGKRKDRHNKELLFWLERLLDAGCIHYSLHHLREAGCTKSLPLQLGGKWYDLSYVAEDGEIFLVEIMRAGVLYCDDDEEPGK